MRTVIAAATLFLAAATLTSCSEEPSEPSALIGKSPEEIATYLVFGIKDKSKFVSQNGDLSAEVTATKPFTIVFSGRNGARSVELMRVVTTRANNCVFEFDTNRTTEFRNPGKDKYSVDLSKLSSITQVDSTGAAFSDAVFTCMEPADQPWCAERKAFAPEYWTRVAFERDLSVDDNSTSGLLKKVRPEQKQIDATLTYLQKEICP